MLLPRASSDLASSNVGPVPQKTPGNRLVTAKNWGITKYQLRQFAEECRADPHWDAADNVRDFVVKFVEPRTHGSWMGISLTLNQLEPKLIDLMISHSWEENADMFFRDLDRFMMDSEVAFICFLALYQGNSHDIKAQLGSNVRRGPFTEVIGSVRRLHGRLLVVPCEELRDNGQGLYSRMWCDWEIFCAAEVGLPIHFTHRNSAEHIFGAGSFSSRTARCGNPQLAMLEGSDEWMIRQEIERLRFLSPKEREFRCKIFVFVFVLSVSSLANFLARSGLREDWLYSDHLSAGVDSWVPTFLVCSIVVCFPSALMAGTYGFLVARNGDCYARLDHVIMLALRYSEVREFNYLTVFMWLYNICVVVDTCLLVGWLLDILLIKLGHQELIQSSGLAWPCAVLGFISLLFTSCFTRGTLWRCPLKLKLSLLACNIACTILGGLIGVTLSGKDFATGLSDGFLVGFFSPWFLLGIYLLVYACCTLRRRQLAGPGGRRATVGTQTDITNAVCASRRDVAVETEMV